MREVEHTSLGTNPQEVLANTLLSIPRQQRIPHICKVLEGSGLICLADHDNDRRMPFMATCVSRWMVYVPSIGVVCRDPTWSVSMKPFDGLIPGVVVCGRPGRPKSNIGDCQGRNYPPIDGREGG
jgi:hypothetical protein